MSASSYVYRKKSDHFKKVFNNTDLCGLFITSSFGFVVSLSLITISSIVSYNDTYINACDISTSATCSSATLGIITGAIGIICALLGFCRSLLMDDGCGGSLLSFPFLVFTMFVLSIAEGIISLLWPPLDEFSSISYLYVVAALSATCIVIATASMFFAIRVDDAIGLRHMHVTYVKERQVSF